MKISIDTATDSKEDIRKAIRLLQSIVEHDAQGSRDIFNSPSTDLFGSAPASNADSAPSANPASAFGSLFNDDAPVQATAKAPEEKKDIPKIELY